MSIHSWRMYKAALLAAAPALLMTAAAGSALAQGPGLPRTYDVQRVDSPLPALAGGFGLSSSPIGDLDGDGEVDIASVQTVGTPGNNGVIWVHSGETGALLGSVTAPDPGNPTGAANNNNAIVDRFVDRLTDIGRCVNPPPAGDPDKTCRDTTIGPPDGANEILVGAEGVDVGNVKDVGRVYVLDGRTLAVLKRIDMPPSDRQLIADRQAQFPTLTNIRGGFGRTAVNPRGLPPCEGNSGVGPCPAMPPAVRIGDLDGRGLPDIVIGANRFPEVASTAHPDSHCRREAGDTICLDAGRAYVYFGEEIAGTDPRVTLDGQSPGQSVRIIRNIAAQAEREDTSFSRTEIFGHAQMPVGDVGACRSGGNFPAAPAPGERCSIAARTNVPDGKPEFIVAAHRADTPIFNPDPASMDMGVSFLFDGATGALLYIYNHPEPQPNALFGYTTRQSFPVGNVYPLGGTGPLPDVILAGVFQNASGRTQAGRAYVFNGDFNDPFIVRAMLNDPTPHAFERFGVPTEGVGDLVPDKPGNEVLVGAFSSNVGRPDAFSDLHFANPFGEEILQTISDPDAQPGAGFGYQAIPLGDLNEDGFLDFASSSPRWNSPGVGGASGISQAGRLYIFRSDNSPPPAPPPADQPPQPPALAPTAAAPPAVPPPPAPAAARERRRPTLSFTIKPTRDRAAPFRYEVVGRIGRPSTVTAADGCSGRVSAQTKRGRGTTVSTRRANVTRRCTFRIVLTFTSRNRLGNGRLKVRVRFLGNSALSPVTAAFRNIRAG